MNILEEDLIPVQIQLEIIFCATEAGAPANLPWRWANPLNKPQFLCFMLRFSSTRTHKAAAKLWGLRDFTPVKSQFQASTCQQSNPGDRYLPKLLDAALGQSQSPQLTGRFQPHSSVWSQNTLTPLVRHQKCHSEFWNVIPRRAAVPEGRDRGKNCEREAQVSLRAAAAVRDDCQCQQVICRSC